MARDFRYGGQAVMEGVMMLGKKTSATAVRRPNGEIVVKNKPRPRIYTGRLRQTPFARGIIVLIESIILVINSLFYSANIALEEEWTVEGKRRLVREAADIYKIKGTPAAIKRLVEIYTGKTPLILEHSRIAKPSVLGKSYRII